MEKRYKPLVKEFAEGAEIKANLSRIDSAVPQPKTYKIIRAVGSGFASQVYQATDEEGNIVALKAFRSPGKKEKIRDFLHHLAWGLPLPVRVSEDAIRVAEGWHDVLSKALKVEGIEDLTLPHSYGHFLSKELGSLVGVYSWFENDPPAPPVHGSKGEADYRAKKEVIKKIYKLGQKIGFKDGARQFDWWTLVSPLNILTKDANGQRSFCAPDTIPGLPIFPFIPFSPGDIPRAIKIPFQGRMVHFDQTDFKALDYYISWHETAFRELIPTIKKLKEADQRYRRSLPAPLTQFWGRYLNPENRRLMRGLVAQTLEIDQAVDTQTALAINNSDIDAIFHLGLYNIPLIGPKIQRMGFHGGYQEHLKQLVLDGKYRHTQNLKTIAGWEKEGRLGAARLVRLEELDLAVLAERPYSVLPAKLHRFLTDDGYFAKKNISLVKKVWSGIKMVSREHRRDWLIRKIEEGEQNGLVTNKQSETLLQQAESKEADTLIKDTLITTIGAWGVSTIISGELIREALETGNYQLAALITAQLVPGIAKISIASLLRGAYLSGRTIQDRYLKPASDNLHPAAEILNLIASSTAPFGNLSAPIRAMGRLPELSSFLATHYLDKTIKHIPIWGGRGTVTESFFYQILLNPLIKRVTKAEKTEAYETTPVKAEELV